MSYVLSLVVAATVLGATQAGSEEVACLGVSVRWVDGGVTVGASLSNRDDTDSTAVIKEGESEPALLSREIAKTASVRWSSIASKETPQPGRWPWSHRDRAPRDSACAKPQLPRGNK